jgi:uncharacterized membrane protein YfcA
MIMNPISLLKVLLALITFIFLARWWRAMVLERREIAATPTATSVSGTTTPPVKFFPTPGLILIGFITNFFDTLGIGSYAPTTSLFKFTKRVNDRVIPGTMTLGHTLPTVLETNIYLTIVPVDPVTLFSMVASAMIGAWLGAGVVAKLSKRAVQIGMSIALFTAVILLIAKQMSFLPGGGDSLGVHGIKLVIAIAVNFALGALMTIGIGMFAPCMITVYLLGMTPTAAFPIMMSSCAFLMPIGAFPFLREKSYDNRAALGLSIGGIPGVLMAAYLFYQLSIQWVLWLVIGVSAVTAVTLLRSSRDTDPQPEKVWL